MPRYFFNVHNGRVIADADGVELSDATEARVRGVKIAADILREEYLSSPSASWRLIITNEAGERIYQIDFSVSDCKETDE